MCQKSLICANFDIDSDFSYEMPYLIILFTPQELDMVNIGNF